ncbi:MAG: DUF6134 family protein [Rhodospirillaceae bacterium]
MRRASITTIWAAVSCLAASAGAIASADTHSISSDTFDPLDRYGTEILFDVRRNGNSVGFHRVTFARDADGLAVTTRFEIKVDFLFFTAYRYSYQSKARWQSDQLVSLDVQVDDDGAEASLRALRGKDGLAVDRAETRHTIDQSIYPTNHWHPGVIGEVRVLNTLTGRVNDVTIRPSGSEPVTTEVGNVMATRYVYTGDLENEVWYDNEGRWVKMRFLGRDGSTIEYVCRRCQGRDPRQARQ